jgi:hypothetical protein
MLLVLSVILIASIVLYMGFTKVKSMNEKILMVSAYILLIGLVFKYMMTQEGFQVKMDDEEFINNVEKLDKEAAEMFNNNGETATTTTNATSTTTNEDNTSTEEKESTFNPTLVVNIPDETPEGNTKIVVQNPHTDPFAPSEELFKSTCNNSEYFKNDTNEKFGVNGNTENFNNNDPNSPRYVPYVDNSVSGYRLYTSRYFVPGMAFIPPTEWDVPQPHKTAGDCNMVCNQTMPNTRQLPIAMMDYGTPINALELGADGMIAKREEDAPLTSVGSIMPKFEYREYVDCYKYEQPNSPGVAQQSTSSTSTTSTTA